MARGWIKIVVVLALVGATATESWAQKGAARKPGGSLASRFGQLFNGNSAADDEKAYAPEDYSSPRNRTPAKQSSGSQPARSSAQNRVLPGDLLPKGIFFDRNSQDQVSADDIELGDEVFNSSPRRGSVAAAAATIRTPRKSPATTRENELQDALDDLLAVEQEQLSEPAGNTTAIEPLPNPNQRQPAANNTRSAAADADAREFDLRQAMIEKANTGEKAVRSEAVNDLRQQLESLQEKAPVEHEQNTSLADPFDRQNKEIFASPTQEFAPTRQPAAPRQTGGFLTTGGETLLSSKQPVIVSRVEGPRQIMVGREATYRVVLENSSEADARGLSAEVRIPDWAEVVDVNSTSGTVERSDIDGTGALRWQLQQLAGRSAQSLSVRLIPRSGKPLNLSVAWTQAAIASQTMVEVQEPKLEMKISGPQEVLFNKAQRFQLSLRNPGTGSAENVIIKLVPPGCDEASASSHTVGVLEAGAVKEIELELTAREAGELTMKASATASGGLHSEAVRNVLCRKAELELDWRGPAEKYAGTEASYYFRVRNAGTADTDAVAMRIKLPQGVKLVSASEGYKLDSQKGEITWQVESIAAGQAEFMQLNCEVVRAGMNRFDVSAQTASGDLKSSKAIETNVMAIADLKLTVSDPKGPVPVGETAIYEIRIRNRGTTDAQNVGVVGLFSAGIDPNAVEGAQFSVRDGRVSIHPINTLPAGEEMVLKIRAVAKQAGTHVFRAEVSCEDLDIKLAAEETTKFYEDQYRWEDGETAYSNDPNAVGTR